MSRGIVVFVGLLATTIGALIAMASFSSSTNRIEGLSIGSIIAGFGFVISLVGIRGKYTGQCPVCGENRVSFARKVESSVVRHKYCRDCGASWIPNVSRISAIFGILFTTSVFTFVATELWPVIVEPINHRYFSSEGIFWMIVGMASFSGFIYYLRVLFGKAGRLKILESSEHA